MENKKIEQQLADIQEQLNYITAQMREQERKNRELTELKNDLSLIGKDIFDAAVEELEDVAPYFDTKDLLYLFKKFLRNINSITKLFTYMESANDLFDDLKPLGKQVFDDWMDKLNEMDQKGYFEFASELFKIIDTIVTEFTVEDVVLLRENIVSILLTVKNMTQPEMLNSANNALSFFKKMDIEVEKDISFFQLLKKAREPEVKKGMYFMLEFVKSMAQPDDLSGLSEAKGGAPKE